jgi:hypothetical protein
MQFSTLIVATLAAVASAGPAVKRQADCPEVDAIPFCGVRSLTLQAQNLFRESDANTENQQQYPCILTAATDIGCGPEDYPCMCGKFADLRLAAAGCVLTNCGAAGVADVLAAAEAVCAACA